jgi:hypothetical protein
MALLDNRVRPDGADPGRRGTNRRRRHRLPLLESLERRELLAGSGITFGGNIQVSRVTLDAAGDTFMAGGLNGQINFDPNGGSGGVVSTTTPTAFVVKYSPSNTLAWVKLFAQAAGTTGGGLIATGVAVDNNTGAAYVTGTFQGTADFNAGGAPSLATSDGGTDGFVVALSPDGALQPVGVRTFGGPGDDSANDVAVVAGGTVYVAGTYTGSVLVDRGNPGSVVTSPVAGASDTFLLRLTPALGFGSVAPLGLANSAADRVAVSGAGTAYIAGGVGNASSSEAIVAQFDAGGHLATLREFGGPSGGGSRAEAVGVVVDAAGNVSLDGFFTGTGVDFGKPFGSPGMVLDSAGGSDAFLVQLNPSLQLNWARRLGSSGDDLAQDLTIDNSGKLYVTGATSGALTFGTTGTGALLIGAHPGGGSQNFELEFSSSGVPTGVPRTFVGTNGAGTTLIAVNNSGRVVVGGVAPGDTANTARIFLNPITPTSTPTPTPTPTPTSTPTSSPPKFTGESRVTGGKGRKKKVVGFRLNFSGALDSVTAQSTFHYQVTQPGKGKGKAKSKSKTIPVGSATYDPASHSVTLVLGKTSAKGALTLTGSGLLGAGTGVVPTFTTPL